MKKVTALELRQSLGKVVSSIQKSGQPVLLEKGRKPVAVLISIADYHERFVEREAHHARNRLLEQMDSLARPSSPGSPAADDALRELRDRG